MYFLVHELRRSSSANKPLPILLFPKDKSVAAREREKDYVSANSVMPFVKRGREICIQQVGQRWFTNRPTDATLILIKLSKQGNSGKVIPQEWQSHANAVYIAALRKHAALLKIEKRSPRIAKKKAASFFDPDSDEESDEGASEPVPVETATTSSDPVIKEMSVFAGISSQVVRSCTLPNGIVNEFKLMTTVKKAVPIHYSLFSALASHVPTEQSAEETFSLAGRLSNDNTHSDPTAMATLVRIQQNQDTCNPDDKAIWQAYCDEHRQNDQIPEEEDVYVSADEADDNEDQQEANGDDAG